MTCFKKVLQISTKKNYFNHYKTNMLIRCVTNIAANVTRFRLENKYNTSCIMIFLILQIINTLPVGPMLLIISSE